MAEEIGLLARLRFDGSAAVLGMSRASAAFKKLQLNARAVKAGVGDIKRAFGGTRIAALALAAGGAVAVKRFTSFEKQFGGLKSVLGVAHKDTFPALREQAEMLGASTSFTAAQATEAMENLARAGLKPREIMSSITPVLAAAAAEGIGLATAADIVASNMKAFGLQAKDATRIADALAFVSAKTNTNMVGLQEGMKFVAPVARALKIPLEDTAAALGVLADVGLKGSLAGTGLKNALLKLSVQAKDGKVKVGKFNAEIVKTADGGVDLSKTMLNIVGTLGKIPDPLKKSAAAMKLFGLRGLPAATAFEALSPEKVKTLFDNMQKGAKGTAAAMQKMRLDNISGDFVRMTSALDNAAIKIGSVLAPTVRSFAKGATRFFGDVGKAFVALEKGIKPEKLIFGTKKLSKTAVDFVVGFKEGIAGAKAIFVDFFGAIKGVAKFLGIGTGGMRDFVRQGLKIAAVVVSAKLLVGTLRRVGLVARGSLRILAGGLGAAKGGITATIGLLSRRFPALARVLPGSLRKLTGAVTGLEKITAQPVRVVNFDEAGGILGGRRGGPPPIPADAPAGKVGRFGGLISAVKQVAVKALLPAIVATKVGLASAQAKQAQVAKARKDIANERNRLEIGAISLVRQAGRLAALRRGGAATFQSKELGKAALTKANVERVLRAKGGREGLTRGEVAGVLAKLSAVLATLPQEVKKGVEGANIKTTISTSDVSKGVAGKRQEAAARSGRTPAQSRSRAARGAS